MRSWTIRSNPTTPPFCPQPSSESRRERDPHCSVKKLRQSYGATAIDYLHGRSRTMAGFEIKEKKNRAAIDKITERIKKHNVRCGSLPRRVPLADSRKGQEAVKLSSERKHLTNILKMIAYQMDSDLGALVRPHYKRE